MVTFIYGIICYLIFFVTFLYAVGFTGNFIVPKDINGGVVGSFFQSLTVNIALLSLFALQHSVMARPGFKRWWTKYIPKAAERSTYVLLSSVVLIILFWQWRPMLGIVWHIENAMVRSAVFGLCAVGWLITLSSSCMIDHFELFGLKQIFFHLKNKNVRAHGFKKPALYRVVRHPIMLGFFIAFWAAPTMTVGHLIFAIGTTLYIVIGVWFEERDLVCHFGKDYSEYQKEVSMLLPFPKKNIK
ncbi:methanethiol S-methyltransferase [Candidatus Uabimicrobium amorphum]|uniref:methanethiol S-methyltransferase n=1 Tax=Uabimicrobium amorphum TaxID=2596890 RepID=A0A5S9IJ13_UABAM|nr:methanethiol S-methyltransferase [Candidatus Uabimicrobium amorphum]BBM81950.1 membrane protein [Candidatus Uabimicrobium amorphum]